MSPLCASSLLLRQGGTLVFAFISVTLLFDLRQSKMTAFCAEIPKRNITCRAGTFLPGQNASVSCNFPTDVAADGDDIIVSRLPVNASKDAIWFDTLVCGWKGIKRPYECIVAKGFCFDGVISDQLTLHIPDVDIDKAGMYICFIVSSDVSSAECTLTVEENQSPSPETKNENSTSIPSNEKGEGINVVLLCIIIGNSLFAMLVGLVFFVWCCFARSRNRPVSSKQRFDKIKRDPMSTKPLIPTSLLDKKVLYLLEIFEFSTTDFKEIMQSLHDEMRDCKRRIRFSSDATDISHEGDKQARHKMYSVPLKCLPTETVTVEDGISVVEISNTIVRIHNVNLQDPQPNTTSMNYIIPEDIRKGTGIQLLDFVADCAQTFYKHRFHSKKLYLGFIFPFPCEYQHDLTQARFTSWNSGFRLEDLAGKNVQELLCEAFHRKHPKSRLKVTIIISNAVGILLSLVSTDLHCRIGVSLTDGFHACYLHTENSSGTNSAEDKMVITSIVLGAFGENGCLKKFITEFDKELDLHSIHPGKQILEKMVSMAFIGETVRLVLTKLATKGLLFSSDSSRALLNKKDSFTVDYISLIESDRSEHYLFTDFVLRQLQIEHYTMEDCRTVSYVVQSVLKRAAHLAATVLVVLVNQDDTPKVTIVVDGDLSCYHPVFLQLLREKTQELLLKSEKEVEFKASYHGSAIGAALTVS